MIYIIILFFNISLCGLINPAHNDSLNFTHVLFEWDQEPYAVSYNFQLSTSENFNNESIILEHNETSTIFIEKNLINWENTYFWRIQPIYLDGNIGSFSNVSSFTTKESLSNISINLVDESYVSEGLTLFCDWSDYKSIGFNKFGKEIWNSGDLNFIFTAINNFGELLGHNNTEAILNPIRAAKTTFKENVIWDEPDGWGLDVHEFIQLPNGNYLGFYNTTLNGPIPNNISLTNLFQLIGYVADGITEEFPWLAPILIEFDRDTKEIVWSWNYFDFFNMDDFFLGA